MLGFLSTLTGSSSTDPSGPAQIIEAVYGSRSVYDVETAYMDEPRLQDFGTEYFTDYKVVIPLSVDADMTMPPFIFEVPEDPALGDGVLGELANYYDIEKIEDIANFEGSPVPIDWSDGHPAPEVNVLRNKDGTKNQWTPGDIEDELQKDAE